MLPRDFTASGVAFGFGCAGNVHADKGLGIFGEGSGGGYDQNIPQFVAVAGANLLNARIVDPRCFVGKGPASRGSKR
jgi:hypothetical protein